MTEKMSESGTKVKIVWRSSSGRWRTGGRVASLFKEQSYRESCECADSVPTVEGGELPDTQLPSVLSCRLAIADMSKYV